MKKNLMAIITVAGLVMFIVTGCATKASVQKEPVAVQEETVPVEIEPEVAQREPCTTPQMALERAEQLTRASFYDATEFDGAVRFAFDSYALSPEAKSALDYFANSLMETNKDVFVELQGHTDDFGEDDYNFDLGLARARAAMGYLYTKHGIPLQRMNGFSCGESKPVADNTIEEGRSKNRRVTLVVIE
ncbi:MAG: OmpA family protein [Deltaproteobacteria bacterium]|nr:MAG: OmpA family protein [Deltaproteobacteria bacterium]